MSATYETIRASSGTQYEYKVIDPGKDIEAELNALGADGWQVVGVTTKKQLLIAPPQAIILVREVPRRDLRRRRAAAFADNSTKGVAMATIPHDRAARASAETHSSTLDTCGHRWRSPRCGSPSCSRLRSGRT